MNKEIIVGSSNRCDYIINDPSVIEEHLKINLKGDEIEIKNLSLTNSTILIRKGKEYKLDKNESIKILRKDSLQLGNHILKVKDVTQISSSGYIAIKHVIPINFSIRQGGAIIITNEKIIIKKFKGANFFMFILLMGLPYLIYLKLKNDKRFKEVKEKGNLHKIITKKKEQNIVIDKNNLKKIECKNSFWGRNKVIIQKKNGGIEKIKILENLYLNQILKNELGNYLVEV